MQQVNGRGLSDRSQAVVIGVLFILATGIGVGNVGVIGPVLSDPDFLTNAAQSAGALGLASVLNVAMSLCITAIAVVFYPVLSPRHPVLAPGYLAARLAEAVIIGIAGCLWYVIGKSGGDTGAGAQGVSVLLAMSNGLFALGAQVVFGVSAIILNAALLQAPIVPRWISLWGLAGGVLIVILGGVQMLGYSIERIEAAMTVPVALNEMVLALWLIVKGFRPQVAQ